jgi:hypothetical protein
MPDTREEAAAAAAWWAGVLRVAGVDADRVAVFEQLLAQRIEALCEDAGWQPDVPTYGTCGRQVTSGPRPDAALAPAAREAGLSTLLDRLPSAVMWVNPGEVLVQAAGDDEPTQVWPAPARPAG